MNEWIVYFDKMMCVSLWQQHSLRLYFPFWSMSENVNTGSQSSRWSVVTDLPVMFMAPLVGSTCEQRWRVREMVLVAKQKSQGTIGEGSRSNLMLWESLTYILLLSILKVILYSDSCIFDHYNIIFYLIFLNEMKYFSRKCTKCMILSSVRS